MPKPRRCGCTPGSDAEVACRLHTTKLVEGGCLPFGSPAAMSPPGEVGPWLCVPGFPRVCPCRGNVAPLIDRLPLHLSGNAGARDGGRTWAGLAEHPRQGHAHGDDWLVGPASNVLDERMPTTTTLTLRSCSRALASVAAAPSTCRDRPQPVGIPVGAVPGRWRQLLQHRRIPRRLIGGDPGGHDLVAPRPAGRTGARRWRPAVRRRTPR